MEQNMDDLARSAAGAVANKAKQYVKEALKKAAKAAIKKLLIIIGVKGCLVIVVILLAVLTVSSVFEVSAIGGNFTGDPDMDGNNQFNQVLKDSYMKLSNSTISNEQEKPYQLNWGVLAALDKLANNNENPVPGKNVVILGPRFTYKDSTITTNKRIVVTINIGTVKNPINIQTAKYEKKVQNVRLLAKADTFEGIYSYNYKWVTLHPDDSTTTIKEELVGIYHTADYTRLITRLNELGLNPETDMDWVVTLGRAFQGDDPELELDADLADADSSGDDIYVEPGEPSAYGFIWPIPGHSTISSHFGPRIAPVPGASTMHKGVDIAAPVGSVVVASKEGIVVFAQPAGKAGNLLIIDHGNGVKTLYLHLDRFLVSEGDQVSAGQKVAASGNTGIGTGAHLDFRIKFGGTYVNSLMYVGS